MGNRCARAPGPGGESDLRQGGALFYRKSATRNCYLFDFSTLPLRGAEIRHIAYFLNTLCECILRLSLTLTEVESIKEMPVTVPFLNSG
ncbi:hypothetical protein QUF90_00950 [Desulfococcaceae bacterium HSG9]|nr:hypothetical protein [Desulfococcaceae bacterium HSG9]